MKFLQQQHNLLFNILFSVSKATFHSRCESGTLVSNVWTWRRLQLRRNFSWYYTGL